MESWEYEEVEGLTPDEVEAAIARNSFEELLYVPIAVSVHSSDFDWAQAICVKLSGHEDFNVRGNAVLGFGHLARRFGKLEKDIVKPIIESAMLDPHEYVRTHANDAADDIRHFLRWRFSKPS